MRQAAGDLCWLLNRGYALTSSVELVGNRYELVRRQRIAVGRCVCSDAARLRRRQHEVSVAQIRGGEVWLDGYNILNVLESALAGAVILRGRDDCCRDMAGTHGGYRAVEETMPALHLLGELVDGWEGTRCCWFLDKPVSNSGRLKHVLLELATRKGWGWEVELVFSPDKVLAETPHAVVTSDSVILDRCSQWINLAGLIIDSQIPQAHVVDLSCGE